MKKGLLISVIIIALGTGWLLNTLHFIGGVDWLWTLLLAATGLLSLAVFKFNKLNFVLGSFLIIGSVFSILRQTNIISADIEIPILVILFGILFFIAQLPSIPVPEAIARMKAEEEAKKKP